MKEHNPSEDEHHSSTTYIGAQNSTPDSLTLRQLERTAKQPPLPQIVSTTEENLGLPDKKEVGLSILENVVTANQTKLERMSNNNGNGLDNSDGTTMSKSKASPVAEEIEVNGSESLPVTNGIQLEKLGLLPVTNGSDPENFPATDGSDPNILPVTNGSDPDIFPVTNGTDPDILPVTNGSDPNILPVTYGSDPYILPVINGTDPERSGLLPVTDQEGSVRDRTDTEVYELLSVTNETDLGGSTISDSDVKILNEVNEPMRINASDSRVEMHDNSPETKLANEIESESVNLTTSFGENEMKERENMTVPILTTATTTEFSLNSGTDMIVDTLQPFIGEKELINTSTVPALLDDVESTSIRTVSSTEYEKVQSNQFETMTDGESSTYLITEEGNLGTTSSEKEDISEMENTSPVTEFTDSTIDNLLETTSEIHEAYGDDEMISDRSLLRTEAYENTISTWDVEVSNTTSGDGVTMETDFFDIYNDSTTLKYSTTDLNVDINGIETGTVPSPNDVLTIDIIEDLENEQNATTYVSSIDNSETELAYDSGYVGDNLTLSSRSSSESPVIPKNYVSTIPIEFHDNSPMSNNSSLLGQSDISHSHFVIGLVSLSALVLLLVLIVVMLVVRRNSLRQKVYVSPTKTADSSSSTNYTDSIDYNVNEKISKKNLLTKPMPPAIMPQESMYGEEMSYSFSENNLDFVRCTQNFPLYQISAGTRNTSRGTESSSLSPQSTTPKSCYSDVNVNAFHSTENYRKASPKQSVGSIGSLDLTLSSSSIESEGKRPHTSLNMDDHISTSASQVCVKADVHADSTQRSYGTTSTFEPQNTSQTDPHLSITFSAIDKTPPNSSHLSAGVVPQSPAVYSSHGNHLILMSPNSLHPKIMPPCFKNRDSSA